MNQEDQEIINSFKQVVEYFAKKSTFEIVSQYKNLFENALENVPQKHEFSSLLEAYRNSSPKAIKITFDQDIKRISSKNRYLTQILTQLHELKKNSAPIIQNLKCISEINVFTIESIIESAERIDLFNIESERNLISQLSLKELTNSLQSISNAFFILKSELPFTKGNIIIIKAILDNWIINFFRIYVHWCQD